MEKVKVRSLSAVGIIYLVSDPSRVLVNMNPGGTTPRAFQWTLNLLGGEWSGRLAQADANPLSTFRRSVEADLGITFKRAEASLHGKDDGGFTREQSSMFLNFRKAVVAKAVPWRDYLVSIDEAVLGTVPGGHEPPYDALVSYHLVGIEESEWHYLTQTLERFRNVSRSGFAHTATYSDIIARGQVFGFGHETAMADFWSEYGHFDAGHLKRMLPMAAQQLGRPLSTYKEYVSAYDFAVRP
jgi:hypothetical protein